MQMPLFSQFVYFYKLGQGAGFFRTRARARLKDVGNRMRARLKIGGIFGFHLECER